MYHYLEMCPINLTRKNIMGKKPSEGR